MILTVTANPALDLTYQVGELQAGQTHRVSAVQARGGGKGLNVARVLAALGWDVTAVGLAGGHTGRTVRDRLQAAGVRVRFTDIAGETRRTVVVHDGARTTGFWEPGPVVSGSEWSALVACYRETLADADAIVLAGSLPPGAPAGAYAALIREAHQCSTPVILDADGEALRRALPARPDVVKPNADELRRALGVAAHPLAGAAALRKMGARASVVSLGPDGLAAAADGECWEAAAPEVITGNASGAGDAAVAGLAMGLVRGWQWPDTLRHAVALGSAAVHTPAAGEVDLAAYRRYLTAVEVRAVPAPEGF